MRKIIVGLDDSELAWKALERCVDMAVCLGDELVLVCAVDAVGPLTLGKGVEDLDEAMTGACRRVLKRGLGLAEEAGARARARLGAGRASDVICQAALDEAADEVVVGARGKTAVDKMLLGSVSTRLLDMAPCTVTVVR